MDRKAVNRVNVDRFCQGAKSKLQKPLARYTPEELPGVVSQFEQMLKKQKVTA
jgi:hypothetical protein